MLAAAGITSFIDLTQSRELTAYDGLLPKGVDYLRWPIQDHGVPADRKQVESLLAYVRHALDAGKIIYLHCRAGIGRTGTIAGCLLAEQGLSGTDALAELNRLWKQCARSARWPEVPETFEQSQFVRHWKRAAAPADATAGAGYPGRRARAARSLPGQHSWASRSGMPWPRRPSSSGRRRFTPVRRPSGRRPVRPAARRLER